MGSSAVVFKFIDARFDHEQMLGQHPETLLGLASGRLHLPGREHPRGHGHDQAREPGNDREEGHQRPQSRGHDADPSLVETPGLLEPWRPGFLEQSRGAALLTQWAWGCGAADGSVARACRSAVFAALAAWAAWAAS